MAQVAILKIGSLHLGYMFCRMLETIGYSIFQNKGAHKKIGAKKDVITSFWDFILLIFSISCEIHKKNHAHTLDIVCRFL